MFHYKNFTKAFILRLVATGSFPILHTKVKNGKQTYNFIKSRKKSKSWGLKFEALLSYALFPFNLC